MAGLDDGGAIGGPGCGAGRREADDITFRIAVPRPCLITRVGSDAVLYPLYCRAAEPGRRHPQALRLIGLWRDRVAELARHGWDPAPSSDTAATARCFSRIRNCSPKCRSLRSGSRRRRRSTRRSPPMRRPARS